MRPTCTKRLPPGFCPGKVRLTRKPGPEASHTLHGGREFAEFAGRYTRGYGTRVRRTSERGGSFSAVFCPAPMCAVP
ncbi:hypothetical protein [Desulfallas thermosapovorans]|uniref:hypothetical protein n=1 Tax=Desulfallas thermosapovorans TaxID=58137 RepID=UPI001411FBFC|nr:hypothetical protein [Desulfallas thermosapovorans]